MKGLKNPAFASRNKRRFDKEYPKCPYCGVLCADIGSLADHSYFCDKRTEALDRRSQYEVRIGPVVCDGR